MRLYILGFICCLGLRADLLTVSGGCSVLASTMPNCEFLIPDFDSSLGILNSAYISWSVNDPAGGYIDIVPVGSPFNYPVTLAKVTETFSASFGGVSDSVVSTFGPLTVNQSQNCIGDFAFIDCAPTFSAGGRLAASGTVTDLTAFLSGSPDVLGNGYMILPGNVTFAFTTSPTDVLGNTIFAAAGNYEPNFSATVTYEYTPVPEPSYGVILSFVVALMLAGNLKSNHSVD